MLVGKVLRVFSHTAPGPSDLLRDKWAKIALQVRGGEGVGEVRGGGEGWL